MAELTRGQKAAATRAKNKAAREQTKAKGIPADELREYIDSLTDTFYGVVLKNAEAVHEINGVKFKAVFDGEQWLLVF